MNAKVKAKKEHMPYERILIAVDGSESAETALDEAIKLAKFFHAKLRIITIIDQYVGYIDGIMLNTDVETDSSREYGESLLKVMSHFAQTAGVEVETNLIEINEKSSKVADKILHEADEWKADLLVLGTHGRQGIKRFILGSIAESVVRLSKIPTLLVRGHKKKK